MKKLQLKNYDFTKPIAKVIDCNNNQFTLNFYDYVSDENKKNILKFLIKNGLMVKSSKDNLCKIEKK